MAVLSLPTPSLPFTLLVLVVFFSCYRIFFELTTGARRRRMIKENGCEPPYYYPHKGILGRLYGWDVITEMVKSSKEGRMNEANRLRNWGRGHKTLHTRIARRHSE